MSDYNDLKVLHRELRDGQRFVAADGYTETRRFHCEGRPPPVLPLRTAEPVRLDQTDVTLGHPVCVVASGEIWRPEAGYWLTSGKQSRFLRDNADVMVDVIGMPSEPEPKKSDLLRFIDRVGRIVPDPTPTDRVEVELKVAFHREKGASADEVRYWLIDAWNCEPSCGLSDDKPDLEIIDIEVTQGLPRRDLS